MKSLIYAAAAASMILATPAVSFAQSNDPMTREQVRAELVQLQKAGFKQNRPHDADYPVRIQAAEARVAAQRAAGQSNPGE